MTLFIDITNLETARSNTGIQRVTKEFIKRAIKDTALNVKILIINKTLQNIEILDNKEVELFLKDSKTYNFKQKKKFNLTTFKPKEKTAFFDIDSTWNIVYTRDKLYPILKQNGFLIFNFIYDLIPIVAPQFTNGLVAKNFKIYLDAVYKYSDLVLLDSQSAQNDFLSVKFKKNIQRNIPTRTVSLGSNFMQSNVEIENKTINDILQKKYILFVGTIEPRKNHADVLEAFDTLSNKYKDLNLVFIGKKGWSVDPLIEKIQKHPLKDKRFFWLNNIDDDILSHFYQNAFIVTYLSSYEGYGLPIAESLNYANITIASKNSSMYEVGKDYADYVTYGSQNEIIDIISLYCDNKDLYALKKQHIKENFTPLSWQQFYTSISNIFINYEKSQTIIEKHLKKLQFVFISIEINSIKETIKEIDKYMDFVKEYIIVTAPKFINKFKELKSNHTIIIIDETTILKEHKKDFATKDHQSKNWLLRASLLNLNILEDEFIMLDDDNRPLKPMSIDKFITKEGKYNAYFYNHLLEWNHKGTEYDIGQQNTKKVLSDKNYELLSYSSHAPQIINKKIFKEAIDEFFHIGLEIPIDEWSIYFNYAISMYPNSFNKKIFETINWPENPFQWDTPYLYKQNELSFENYYESIYNNHTFEKNTTYEEKIKIKQKQMAPFQITKKLFENSIDIYRKNNMVHGVCQFINEDIQLYLSSIPYFVVVRQDSAVRLKLNYRIINKTSKKLDISLILFLNGNFRTQRVLNALTDATYQESIIEIPVTSQRLRENIYNISFHIKSSDKYIYPKTSPYNTKLIVTSKDNLQDALQIPKNQKIQDTSIKQKIKSVPLLGWFARWSYNLLRLNNLKHTIFMQQQQINKLQTQTKQNAVYIQTLLKDNRQHHENYKNIQKNLIHEVHKQVTKHITNQALLFNNTIQEYISTQPTLQTKDPKLPTPVLLDDFYLSFENIFRGSRELILQRYQDYLKYLTPNIKTALDIGCGRAEWVELLQQNSIQSHGVDQNAAMLNIAKEKGIKNLNKADAFEYLSSCQDNTFDLISAFHIIEHIPYEKLLTLFIEIKRVSAPNATIFLETPNPQNLTVSSYEFYKDPTHLNPLPAPVVKFMMEYIGFKEVIIHYIHPLEQQKSTPTSAQDYLIVAKK